MFDRKCYRFAVVAVAIVCGTIASPRPVTAGPLIDWLLGRHTAYYPAYPVQPGVAQTSYYAPAVTPYSAYLAPMTSFTGTGNVYPSSATTAYTGVAPTASVYPTVANYGAGYGAANYTANYSPSIAPVTAYSPATSYPPATAYAPVTSYAPAIGYATPTTAYSPVINTAPTTISTYPTYPVYQSGGLFGGLRRMFRPLWPWGSGYATSYYPAQVTYYRPTTVLSPTTLLPTTSLSACSSYQMQVQRLPSASFLPAAPAPLTDGSCGCAAPYAQAPYAQAPSTVYPPAATYPGGTYPPAATYPPATPPGYNPGSPSNGGSSPSDIMPVPQPQLSPTSGYYSLSPNPAYNSGALPQYPSASTSPSTPGPVIQPISPSNGASEFSNEPQARPIPAPEPSAFGPASNARSAQRESTFKTIQWTTYKEPLPTLPRPAQPVQKKYDDRGWK